MHVAPSNPAMLNLDWLGGGVLSPIGSARSVSSRSAPRVPSTLVWELYNREFI